MCWKHREQQRFNDGTYKHVPVALPHHPADHFLHLSVTETESDTVAYTPCAEYGERDRQVRLKFGRYLRKTFADLSDAEIQGYVTQLKAALAIQETAPVLKFAKDRETINRIFETEMNACGSSSASCMHGKFDGWTVRPYHVYADSPDVAVAYVVAGDAIIARSVVSVKDKVWVRLYAAGDNDTNCGTLRTLLAEAGYSEGDLWGNRLTNLGDKCVPYIDNGGAHIEDAGKWWVVCQYDGDYEADCTDGTATALNRCERCNNDQDDCECSYCECCEESYYEGCPTCSMCEECDGCREHGGCHCARCSDCGELLESRSRYTTTCDCDRCSECNELTDDCECEQDEEDSDDDEAEVEAAPVTAAAYEEYVDTVLPDLLLTPRQVREKLNRIWCYLRGHQAHGYLPPSDAMNVIKQAFEDVKDAELEEVAA